MAGHVVVGVDLAGSPRRPTGACRLRGLRAETAVLFTDDEIVAFVRTSRPKLVTIDAPLHLPPGRRSIDDRNGEHYRPCDIALRELCIPFFPITLGPMRMLTVRGIALKKRLARAGFRVLEMYPGGAQDVWKIPRARRDRAGLRAGLSRLGLLGLRPGATADELDAATGALVGRLFLQGRARVLGDFASGAILLPGVSSRSRGRRAASAARARGGLSEAP
jgi:predicted nuclease with RNAse H fold